MNQPKMNPDKTQPPTFVEPLANPNRLRWFGAGFGGLLFGAICVLLPSPAEAQCPQWDVSGKWQLEQSDGLTVTVDLRQSGKTVTGTAVCYTLTAPSKFLGVLPEGRDPLTLRGPVTGNIAGDDFFAEIKWSYESIGVYRGKVGPQGRVEGTVYDKGASSKKITWVSPNLMKCQKQLSASASRALYGSLTAPAPTASPKRLIKSSGKGPTAVTPPETAEPTAAASQKRIISSSGKAPTDTGSAAGVPKIIAFAKPGQAPGTQTLTWDGGPDHPYAEVWVSVDGGDETKVVEQGKGSRQVTVEPGRTYRYVLTDSGQQLATTTAKGK